VCWAVHCGLPRVAVPSKACTIPHDFDTLCALAEGPSLVSGGKPGTIREAVVVRPLTGRFDPKAGRIYFKIVSPAYLERY